MPETNYSEIEQLIGKSPSWIVKSGSIIIFFSMIGIFLLSFFIKYPEIITSQVVLTSSNKPITLITYSEGWIIPWDKKIGEKVLKGEVVAEVSSEIAYDRVKKLKEYVINVEKFIKSDSSNQFVPEEFDELGDLQIPFNELNKVIKEIILYTNQNDEYMKMVNLKSEIQRKNNHLRLSKSLLPLYTEKYLLSKKNFSRDSLLRKENVTADFDIEQSKSLLISSKLDYENEKIKIKQIENDISYMVRNILLIEEQQSTKVAQFKIAISTALNHLKSRISSWENTYLIRSPISGTISFYKDWENGEFVTKGEEFATIVPSESAIYGVCYVNQEGYGRIKTGQIASIKLNDYPYYEFGKLDARVSFVSNLNREQGYYVKLNIGKKLVTRYNNEINFNREMIGTADIVTKDLSLFDRFINQIKSTVDN